MAPQPHKQRLLMVRHNLDNFPSYPLPPGWCLRPYTPHDEQHWTRIQQAADQLITITPEVFQQYFGSAVDQLPLRQYYAFKPGLPPAATVTAWFQNNFLGQDWGRVHWLAVLPEFQGQGLGKALLGFACSRLRELGHTRVMLSTSPLRTQAVRLYHQFGFVDVHE